MWDRLTSVCIKAVQGIFLLRWRGLHVGRVGELGKIYLQNHPQILWSWLSPIYTVILTTINHLYSCNWKISLGEPSSAALAPCIRGCRGSLEPFSGENIQVSGSPQARVLGSQVLLRREFKTSHQLRIRAPLTFVVEKTSTKLHISVWYMQSDTYSVHRPQGSIVNKPHQLFPFKL